MMMKFIRRQLLVSFSFSRPNLESNPLLHVNKYDMDGSAELEENYLKEKKTK